MVGPRRTEIIPEEEFREQFLNAIRLDFVRFRRIESPQHPFDLNLRKISVASLLCTLRYLGLRCSEIVGCSPVSYQTKTGIKWSSAHTGILKRHVLIDDNIIRIVSNSPLKHGKRSQPLWIHRDKLGSETIVKQYERTQHENDRLFPVSRTQAWRLIKQISHHNSHPHLYRHSLATKLADHPDTTIRDLKSWFGWSDPRTIDAYLSARGDLTRRVSDRI